MEDATPISYRSILKEQDSPVSSRKDRLGNNFEERSQKVTFIDQILGKPIRVVYEVEKLVYETTDCDSRMKTGCSCDIF